MTNRTLYLIQSSYAHTDQTIKTLLKVYASEDAVVLMGDAILFVNDERLKNLDSVYVLESDLELLAHDLPDEISSLSYAQFADLVVHFTRSVSLK